MSADDTSFVVLLRLCESTDEVLGELEEHLALRERDVTAKTSSSSGADRLVGNLVAKMAELTEAACACRAEALAKEVQLEELSGTVEAKERQILELEGSRGKLMERLAELQQVHMSEDAQAKLMCLLDEKCRRIIDLERELEERSGEDKDEELLQKVKTKSRTLRDTDYDAKMQNVGAASRATPAANETLQRQRRVHQQARAHHREPQGAAAEASRQQVRSSSVRNAHHLIIHSLDLS